MARDYFMRLVRRVKSFLFLSLSLYSILCPRSVACAIDRRTNCAFALALSISAPVPEN